ncbi:MAG: geranylgeranyl reductase family protein [Thermoplasmata archaeon]
MERFDVAVVGGGPAGALAARAAAEGGARTILLDHRREIGQPVQCGEFLPSAAELSDLFGCPELIAAAYDIPPTTVLRATRWMTCVSPYGRRYRFPLEGLTVSRRSFDKALVARAEGAGAEIRFPCGVTGLSEDELATTDGTKIRARVIVAADGPTSTIAHAVGFAPRRTMFRMITATTDGPLDDGISLYFGRAAPHGYAWSFPRAHDANVGLGVAALPPSTSLGHLLDRFAARERWGPVRERTVWWVPIGPPPESLVVGRVLFAGDAANLVMATNGAGIPTAMLSGWLAGRTAARAVRDGASLRQYDDAWKPAMYAPLATAARIQAFSDQVGRLDPLLALGMRYIGATGLDSMMRLRWPTRLGGAS